MPLNTNVIVSKLDSLSQALSGTKKQLSKFGGTQVNAQSLRGDIKGVIHFYFNEIRSSLASGGIGVDILDQNMQSLFELANKRASKSLYIKKINDIIRIIPKLQMEKMVSPDDNSESRYDTVELKIVDTLGNLIPSLGVSYQQVLRDLNDRNRVSFRGTTAELREIVRELLDHLAPDEGIVREKGFRLEPGAVKPTMRQKVNFILRARGLARNEMKVAEDTTSVIEKSQDAISAVARSTYNRGSLATHTARGAEWANCKQYKMYVDSVLCEILALHSSADNLPLISEE